MRSAFILTTIHHHLFIAYIHAKLIGTTATMMRPSWSYGSLSVTEETLSAFFKSLTTLLWPSSFAACDTKTGYSSSRLIQVERIGTHRKHDWIRLSSLLKEEVHHVSVPLAACVMEWCQSVGVSKIEKLCRFLV